MKRYLLIFFLSLSCSAYGQTIDGELKTILDTAIVKAKEMSLYSNAVNWDSLESEIYLKAVDAKHIDDLKAAFETLINGLDDHHATARKLSNYSIVASFTDHENARFVDEREFSSEIWSVVNDVESRFEYTILPQNIGYLKVVGIGPNLDGQKEAERIRAALAELHEKKVDKWILDLRYNGGGNVNVMLAGLAPLLDRRIVARIEGGKGELQATAEIKKGNLWFHGTRSYTMDNKLKIKHPKIAVLTSRWTVSSGELLAIAFKGQRDTRFLGEATGGYTTDTWPEAIGGKILLVMATGIFCDRDGNAYKGNVPVDQEIIFEVKSDKSKDNGILKASEWLMIE